MLWNIEKIFIHMVGRNLPVLSIESMWHNTWSEIREDWIGCIENLPHQLLFPWMKRAVPKGHCPRYRTKAWWRAVSEAIKQELRRLSVKKWESLSYIAFEMDFMTPCGSKRNSCPSSLTISNAVAVLESFSPWQRTLKTEQGKAWLTTQDVDTLHQPVHYKFPRRKAIVGGPNQQWQADLIDVSRLSRHNRVIKFLLTCIYAFAKKAWVVPLKDNMDTSLVDAFESLQHSLLKKLQTDKGTEFLNRKFQQWLKAHNVYHFTTENEDIKVSIVEHFNRRLTSKLWVISLDMTQRPIWLYWTRWWTSTTAPHTAVSVWHPMTSLPEIKRVSGSNSMPTP